MNINILATNLRRFRAGRRMSQMALSEKSGVSPGTIKKLENERTEPRVDTLQRLAQALEIPLKDLFVPVRALETVRFRSSRRMQNRENILAEVGRWLDDFCWLETVLDQ